MGRLDGKVAIVTGAAGGQGAAEARLFAREGAKVVATDVQEQLLAEVVQEMNSTFGDVAIGLKLDVVNEQDWEHVVSEAVKHFGKVDILINNAGVGNLGKVGMDNVTLDIWDTILDINVKGNFLGIKKVVPEMRKSGKGSIVNTSSIAGILGSLGNPAYSSSKGANRALTRNMAIELAKDNIRVNCVHPGFIRTPLTKHSEANPQVFQSILASIPLGFPGEPEDVANAVLFLASDDARFITGSELVVDGGQINL